MIIYAACWRDYMEPWGWEADSLFFTRRDAERRLEEMRQASATALVARSTERYEQALRDYDPTPRRIGVAVTISGEPLGARVPPPPTPPITLAKALEAQAHDFCIREYTVR